MLKYVLLGYLPGTSTVWLVEDQKTGHTRAFDTEEEAEFWAERTHEKFPENLYLVHRLSLND